jgi:hypothetical protein
VTDDITDLAQLAADVLDDTCSAATFALGDHPASTLRPVVEAVLAEAGAERWIQKQMDETGIRSMEFSNGGSMEIQPAREMAAAWVGCARSILGNAPNYTETSMTDEPPADSYTMETQLTGQVERFAFILQRIAPGTLTPHEARQKAEARVLELERLLPMEPDGDYTDHEAYYVVGRWGVDGNTTRAKAVRYARKALIEYPGCEARVDRQIIRTWADGSQFIGASETIDLDGEPT